MSGNLKWIQFKKDTFYIYKKYSEGIVYSPLQGKIFSVKGDIRSDINDFITSRGNIQNSFSTELKKSGMLDQMDLPKLPKLKSYKPNVVMLSLSNICNLRCRYCYVGDDNSVVQLPLETIKIIIDQLFQYATETSMDKVEICFHGTGEALTQWNKLVDTVNYALHKKTENTKIDFSLVTNGTLLNPERAEFLASHDFFVTLSMDGIESVQNEQRPQRDGSGSYRYAVNGIRYLVSSGVSFVVRSTVTGKSIHLMPKFVNLCAKLGCKQISFMPFSAIGRGAVGIDSIDPHLFIKSYLKSKKISKRKNIYLSMAGTDINKVNSYYCGAVGFNCVINPEGLISTCSRITKKSDQLAPIFIIGRVAERGFSITEEKRLRLSKLNVFSFQECRPCFAKYICAGGCPHDRLSFANENLEYWCEIVRNLIWYDLCELSQIV